MNDRREREFITDPWKTPRGRASFLRYVMRSWSRAGGGGLRRGRQSVAHGGVAAAADVRAVDEGEVAVGLGRREQDEGAAVPALGRERA